MEGRTMKDKKIEWVRMTNWLRRTLVYQRLRNREVHPIGNGWTVLALHIQAKMMLEMIYIAGRAGKHCPKKNQVLPQVIGEFQEGMKISCSVSIILSACEHGSSQNEVNSLRKVQEEEVNSLKSYQNTPRPPPYVKSKNNVMPPSYVKPKDSKQNGVDEVNDSNWKQRELDNPVHEGQDNGPTGIRSHEKEQYYQDDKIPLPEPRSMRRKHHKSSSTYNGVSHVEDAGAVKRSSSSRRRDNSRKGLQILMDDEHYRKDEEEKMIDELLLHYSKKPSTAVVGKLRKISQTSPPHQVALNISESSHDRDRDGHDVKPEIVPPPTRSVSLPHEQTATSEAKKTFTRANSFQPDSQARHVHPKLPDYEDLAARYSRDDKEQELLKA